ncbi:zinc-binding dehydrogenase [Streptomyces sp. NPDC046931]|uniref:zinc-binding dehydrogenase n=1 Tax=Streptomyces sp. NPDC046931 TaxID=3154806 RepID=UPI003407468D
MVRRPWNRRGSTSDTGRLTVPIGHALPPAEAAQAFRLSKSGRTRGKAVPGPGGGN